MSSEIDDLASTSEKMDMEKRSLNDNKTLFTETCAAVNEKSEKEEQSRNETEELIHNLVMMDTGNRKLIRDFKEKRRQINEDSKKNGKEGKSPSLSDVLLSITSSLLCQLVDVYAKDGSVYSGLFYSLVETGVVLRGARKTKNEKGHNIDGNKAVDTLRVPSDEIVKVVSKRVTLAPNGVEWIITDNDQAVLQEFSNRVLNNEQEELLPPRSRMHEQEEMLPPCSWEQKSDQEEQPPPCSWMQKHDQEEQPSSRSWMQKNDQEEQPPPCSWVEKNDQEEQPPPHSRVQKNEQEEHMPPLSIDQRNVVPYSAEHLNATSSSSSLGYPYSGQGQQNCPYSGRGQQTIPYLGQWQYNYPYRGQGQQTIPYLGQWQHNYPYSGQGLQTIPYLGQWQHNYPYRGQGQQTIPYLGQWQQNYPYRGQWEQTIPYCGQWQQGFPYSGQEQQGFPYCGQWQQGFPYSGQGFPYGGQWQQGFPNSGQWQHTTFYGTQQQHPHEQFGMYNPDDSSPPVFPLHHAATTQIAPCNHVIPPLPAQTRPVSATSSEIGSPNFGMMPVPSRRPDDNVNQTESTKLYQLDLDKIINGEDTRTSLMIKNIPNKYTSKMLLAEIDENHQGTYDFLYLPIDFKFKCNVSYAFINMVSPSHIVAFYKAFNGKKWEKSNSEKVASLTYARIQGKDALAMHFQNSNLMNEDKRCRPILFLSEGQDTSDQEHFLPSSLNICIRQPDESYSGDMLESPEGNSDENLEKD